MKTIVRKRVWTAYGLILPAICVMAALTLYPIGFGVVASFHQWDWMAGQQNYWVFNGLANYLDAFSDARFWSSVWKTLYFTLGALAIEFTLGFAIALLLNQDLKGAWLFRSAIIFPLMVSDIVAAIMFRMILDPTLGVLNYYLSVFHLPTPNWVGSPYAVIPALMLVDTWWQTGNIILILLAGLQGIPRDRIEMAQVDGAHGWTLFRYIILPSLEGFILLAVMFRVIDLMRVFALAWGITSGGPNQASEMSQLYLYMVGSGRFLNIGYASALSVLFALIVGCIALVFVFRLHRREV